MLNHPEACDLSQAWLYAPSVCSVDYPSFSTHSLFSNDTCGFSLLFFVAGCAAYDDVTAVLPESPGFVQVVESVVF